MHGHPHGLTNTHTRTDGWTHSNLHTLTSGILFHAEKCLLRKANERSQGHAHCQEPLQINTPIKYFHVNLPHLLPYSIISLPSLSLSALSNRSADREASFIAGRDLMCGSLCLWRHWSESVSRPNACNVNTHSLHSLLQWSHPLTSQILPYRPPSSAANHVFGDCGWSK